MRYQKIQAKIWNDEKFTQLTPMQQRLFLYILSCPHGNIAGFFVLKTGYACEDLKCLPKDFKKDLASLCESGLVRYDSGPQVVLIPNFFKHNPVTNPNQRKAVVSMLSDLPRTSLTIEFYNICEVLDPKLFEVLPEGLTEGLLKPDSVTDSVTDTEAVTETDILSGSPDIMPPKIPYKEIIEYLNNRVGSRFQDTAEGTRKLITARWNAGATLEDFKYVIDVKALKWEDDPEMCDYLRPKTLFSRDNFEAYKNEKMFKKINGGIKTENGEVISGTQMHNIQVFGQIISEEGARNELTG